MASIFFGKGMSKNSMIRKKISANKSHGSPKSDTVAPTILIKWKKHIRLSYEVKLSWFDHLIIFKEQIGNILRINFEKMSTPANRNIFIKALGQLEDNTLSLQQLPSRGRGKRLHAVNGIKCTGVASVRCWDDWSFWLDCSVISNEGI